MSLLKRTSKSEFKFRIESEYDSILQKEIIPLVGDTTTTNHQLLKAAKQLFGGNKFHGVYASNTIPVNTIKQNQYFIVNLDKSHQPGSHWLAAIKLQKNFIVYDSFGRPTSTILQSNLKNVLDTEYDAEQDPIHEKNCGARCLAFLKIHHMYGTKACLLI